MNQMSDAALASCVRKLNCDTPEQFWAAVGRIDQRENLRIAAAEIARLREALAAEVEWHREKARLWDLDNVRRSEMHRIRAAELEAMLR